MFAQILEYLAFEPIKIVIVVFESLPQLLWECVGQAAVENADEFADRVRDANGSEFGFVEVEPGFLFHLSEGANLNRRHCGKMGLAQLQAQQKGGGSEMDWLPYCVIGTTGKVCCCNSQW